MTLQEAAPSDAVDTEAIGTTEQHAAAEGVKASDSLGSTTSLRDMLMSTTPTQSLQQTESPWNPEQGGMTRVMRGFTKMTGVDGLPAVADICIGTVEFFLGTELGDDVEDVQEERADAAGATGAAGSDLGPHPMAGGGGQ